jgi:hypothetical protein
MILTGFLAFFIISSLLAPTEFDRTRTLIPFDPIDTELAIDISAFATDFKPIHEFANLNLMFVRNSREIEPPRKCEVTIQTLYSQMGTITYFTPGTPDKFDLEFDSLELRSRPREIFLSNMTQFDDLKLVVTVTTDYRNLSAFVFEWGVPAPFAARCRRSHGLFLLAMVVYSGVVYVVSLDLTSLTFTRVFLGVLCVVASFASSPLRRGLSADQAELMDRFCQSLFVWLHRWFLMRQFECLLSSQSAPNSLVLAALALFTGLHQLGEGAISYAKSIAVELPPAIETVRICFALMNAIVVVVYLWLVWRSVDGQTRTIVFTGISAVATAAVTMAVVLVNWESDVVSAMFGVSVEACFASMAFILLRVCPPEEEEYAAIESAENNAFEISGDRLDQDMSDTSTE